MRLLKLVFWLVILGAFVWFGTMVQLGKRTLFGHIVAIARTPEAKDLAEGTKEEAGKVAERMKRDLARDAGSAEQLDDQDREALKKLVKAKAAK